MAINPTLVMYDIEDDKARTKIADACLDYGLDRVQFSAFIGQLSRNHQQELMMRIEQILDDRKGRVQLISIGQQEWKNRIVIGGEYD
ncbi:MAG: CRISPR-associated endonuclease Cas2 [Chloroflexi bacterium]|jgi:CRISPR-associated protein Cas2|nr:CRISPR-associated endonuclease Cas2 [Caldilineaceae bacterium]NOG48195.1 CRISPR-associated endonuclease Cas2 [Chloroflexota bacterium]OQY83649.1 MAG: CRISPR-associated endonuclease Cas2 [Anaerolineae bacterium UTCFX5]GIK29994.1 MAG: CRISPR-associated endoribonuclease Cas2 2 [Chloroflexota bacterium]